jgi:hypothetical protein
MNKYVKFEYIDKNKTKSISEVDKDLLQKKTHLERYKKFVSSITVKVKRLKHIF